MRSGLQNYSNRVLLRHAVKTISRIQEEVGRPLAEIRETNKKLNKLFFICAQQSVT